MTTGAYHRPTDLGEAIGLLQRTAVPSVVLGGGTALNGDGSRSKRDLVDLQALGLDDIRPEDELVTVGAMVRLRDLIDHPATPLLVARCARREGPNTIRNAATIGGTVVQRDPESELLAALLVHDAIVTRVGPEGASESSLPDVLAGPWATGSIITEVRLATPGTGAVERTGRTPADQAIVAAVARRLPDGTIRLAMTGVSTTPVLVDPSMIDRLDPPPDFRGSSGYRRELAAFLSSRVHERLG